MRPILYIFDVTAPANVNLRESLRKERKTCLAPDDFHSGNRHPGIYEATLPSLLVRGMHRAGVRPGDFTSLEFRFDVSLGIAAAFA